MNLFRSEEHVRNWVQFVPDTDEGITPLADLVKLFSGPYFTQRRQPNWVSRSKEYAREMLRTMKEVGKTGPFWLRPKKS
jgi:hypothetical protein